MLGRHAFQARDGGIVFWMIEMGTGYRMVLQTVYTILLSLPNEEIIKFK